MPAQAISTPPALTTTSAIGMDTPQKNTANTKSVIGCVTPETNSTASDASEASDFSSSSSTASSITASMDENEQNVEVENEAKDKEITITMTEHKRQELAGEHKPEPLLEENPGRFVLFPIQNPQVSLFSFLV